MTSHSSKAPVSLELLPPHLVGTADGHRILKAIESVGFIPEKSDLERCFSKGHAVSPDPAKIRKRLRVLRDRAEEKRQEMSRRELLTRSACAARLGATGTEIEAWLACGRLRVAVGIDKTEAASEQAEIFDASDVLCWAGQVKDWRRQDVRRKERLGRKINARHQKCRDAMALGAPAEAFPLARRLSRRIIFHRGPTNSGKTHAALQRLTGASTGLYAAPLRLLAMEGFEHLELHGSSAALLTGEEQIGASCARHLSCTIETLPLGREVEVAVIDEIQLIADPDRGWAWTRALLGAPAREVHLVGAPEALPFIELALKATGEPLEIIDYQRLGSLEIIDRPVQAHEPGDAVVVFSQREVMRLRSRLKAAGYTVAIIYGSLPPEVRRREAARFSSGAAEILVATDAIGLGLNLPIRRVIFGGLCKFDGEHQRGLTYPEIRQIAGRAGRGAGEAGHVGCLPGASLDVVKRALAEPAGTNSAKARLAFRPLIDTHPDAALSWSDRAADMLAAGRMRMAPGWSFETDKATEIGANIVDGHLKCGGRNGELFMAAPFGETMEDPATIAIIRGMAALRSGAKWPIPSDPQSNIASYSGLQTWISHGRSLEIARWYARRAPEGTIDRPMLDAAWYHYVDTISDALASDADFGFGTKTSPN